MSQPDIHRYFRHGTLPQLRLFEASARLGSFTRAAQELHMAQPTASVQIKKLSETVGVPLFEQVGKRLYLTEAGRRLHESCEEVFRVFAALEASLADMRALESAGANRSPGCVAQIAARAASVVLAHVVDHLAVVRQLARRAERDFAAQLGDVADRRDDRLGVRRPVVRNFDVAASSGRRPRDCRRRAAPSPISGCRATIAATCAGCTNMPFTFVVWSARPIQPLMRMLVRPQGARARQHGGQVAGAEADQRIVGVEERRHDDFADLARRDRIAGAGPHDLDQHAFVDDEAFARLGLVGDRAEVGRRVGLVAGDAARGERIAQARRKRFGGHERLA